MSDERDRFRRAMGHFTTGVTVVTVADPERGPVGFTANAVTSVSLDPCLLLVCLGRSSNSLPVLLEAGRFGVSVLRASDAELAHRFATAPASDRFQGVDLLVSDAGTPMLAGSLAWLECTVWRTVEAGDHTVVFGEVADCWADTEGDPLVFFRRGYWTVAGPG